MEDIIEHLHIHFANNVVSHVGGKKRHKSKNEIQKMEIQIRSKEKAAWC